MSIDLHPKKNKFYLEKKPINWWLLYTNVCYHFVMCVYAENFFYEVITICWMGHSAEFILFPLIFFSSLRALESHSELSWLHQILIHDSAYRFSLLKALISIRKSSEWLKCKIIDFMNNGKVFKIYKWHTRPPWKKMEAIIFVFSQRSININEKYLRNIAIRGKRKNLPRESERRVYGNW